ncbi:response regulator transcription factor [Streptomyces sp. NPDC056178]|uniref:response regulator transcription factor n=1 Tax=unclassified Streptomyces TaxID=2593676 RepID=UPI0035DE4F76
MSCLAARPHRSTWPRLTDRGTRRQLHTPEPARFPHGRGRHAAGERAPPTGTALHRSGPREIDVLRLIAEGHDTEVIAKELAYSERTIKNVLHELMTRLQLRNRSHAVAYAMRQGLI